MDFLILGTSIGPLLIRYQRWIRYPRTFWRRSTLIESLEVAGFRKSTPSWFRWTLRQELGCVFLTAEFNKASLRLKLHWFLCSLFMLIIHLVIENPSCFPKRHYYLSWGCRETWGYVLSCQIDWKGVFISSDWKSEGC